MRQKEKAPLGFFKTAVLGALLVVAPVGIVGFALWQVASLVRDLILPVLELLPFDSTLIRICALVAVLLILVLLCYFTGLMLRTSLGRRLRKSLDRRLLERIPGYKIVRNLVHQYLGYEGERQFRPVLVDLYDSGTRQVGLEVEALADGTVAVFLPSVPAVTLGQVMIVPKERVFGMPASMHTAIESLTMFGVGAGALVGDGGEKAHVDIDPEVGT